MENFVVSLVLTHRKITGEINILNHVRIVEAQSADEAKGRMITDSMAENPDHSVFTVVCFPANVTDP